MGLFDSLTSSKHRRLILEVLSKSPRSLKEMGEITGISPPVISRQLKKLSELGLISKDGNCYSITDMGEIAYLAIEKFRRIVSAIEKDPEFWKIHDFSSIPDEFKLRIDELGDYQILRSTKDVVLKHFKVFSSIYSESNIVRILSTVFFPTHPRMFVDISSRSDVEVILSEKALNALKRDYKNELDEYLNNGGKIYYNNEIHFTVITTEKALCIGLFLSDGKYDTESGLLSFDRSAIEWGFDIYEYFKKRSVEYP
ncbi:helix-turn-helix transcriptional regulator [Archaeoglobus neptunius]|uniref:helix-turn-helix transcriptional regulator n=1 Tax=Archaeoglobus neptunius TaxID=2798580 RepID=UPI001926A6CD|nr:winged helix-turn-helix domain-containing protein [Archaeoglobus neptunius]